MCKPIDTLCRCGHAHATRGGGVALAQGHAEIVGAGIAGLVAACALAERGWSVRVHEREADLRSYGSGISCWYNFVKVITAVGARPYLTDYRPLYIRETRDERNRVLYAIKATEKPGEATFLASRRDLINSLAAAARKVGVEILLNSRGKSAEPDGILILEDGTRCPADLVVAADGVNSSVRDSLHLLRKRKQLQQGAIRMMIPRTEEERHSEGGKKSIEYWSGRRRIFYSAANSREVYLAFMVDADDEDAIQVPLRKDIWEKSFGHLTSLIERVGVQGRWDRFEQISLRAWSNGRVAVVGDAAHAMAPNIGQGGGMAAVNALALAATVSEAATVEEGLRRWEKVERPLTDYTQRISYYYGRINDLPGWLRSPAITLCGRIRWIVALRQRPANHNPTGWVRTT